MDMFGEFAQSHTADKQHISAVNNSYNIHAFST